MLGSPSVSGRSCINYGRRSELAIRDPPRDLSCPPLGHFHDALGARSGVTPWVHLSCLCGKGGSEPAPFV